MEMLLFLNESYIFHRLQCGNANYRVPRCLIKPFSVPVTFPFSVKKNIRILDLDPRTEAYCLSPYSVCSKRLPCKKYFYLLNSYNIKRVLGVVYC
ncbi:BAP_1a_G0027610.mRNA.1.CDS.1 [Saccharomyces cerevisiae]|nr:BAP_1a_G0027610.mRNA.1.CDS.1 [Saccharomyces cerevisiae]CAI7084447.1 BAP_1a_G0027610.mRNA.1.CDS.1 [Saccharomyces cerevisiae]